MSGSILYLAVLTVLTKSRSAVYETLPYIFFLMIFSLLFPLCILSKFVFLLAYKDRAIAEAVSRWLPTAAARVCARVGQVGFVVNKVASGQVFSEHFGFPCQIPFHSTNFALRRTDHSSKESS
jgi:hypothetical protein